MTPIRRDRLKLMQTFNAITPEQLEMTLFTLSPSAETIPPPFASDGLRVVALLNWAGSPMGCGLIEVQQVLDKIVKSKLRRW